jgi:hypothetical protein
MRNWYLNTEPRNTIVTEMLDAWKGRNRAQHLINMADDGISARHWHAEWLVCQNALRVLQRIRKVCRETA